MKSFLLELGWVATTAMAVTGLLYIGMALLFFARMRRARENPSFRSHRIALIGPAQAGKTTCLISVLDMVWRGRIRGGAARLRSQSTIRRVAHLVGLLNSGSFPPATLEDETTIYRFDYAATVSALSRAVLTLMGAGFLFRVEAADFAGEQSEKYFSDGAHIDIEDFPDDFSNSATQNFLKWVSESDVCVMFVDVEKYGQGGDAFVRDITAKYMSFWSFYLDIHAEKSFFDKAPPVVVVYTKSDVLLDGRRKPSDEILVLEERLDSEFEDLISFLVDNSRRVTTVAVSALVREDGERCGIEDLVDAILPRAGRP